MFISFITCLRPSRHSIGVNARFTERGRTPTTADAGLPRRLHYPQPISTFCAALGAPRCIRSQCWNFVKGPANGDSMPIGRMPEYHCVSRNVYLRVRLSSRTLFCTKNPYTTACSMHNSIYYLLIASRQTQNEKRLVNSPVADHPLPQHGQVPACAKSVPALAG